LFPRAGSCTGGRCGFPAHLHRVVHSEPDDISIRHFSIPIALGILLLHPAAGALEPWPRVAGAWRGPLGWLSAVLVIVSLATGGRAYPYYVPFLNSLSNGT